MSSNFPLTIDEVPTESVTRTLTTTDSALERARTSPSPTPRPRASRAQLLLKEFKHLLRRGHLYAGLLMLPWVFLYGITGLLFNHPTWFSDQKILSFGRPETKGTLLEKVPTASESAAEVVAAINARGGEEYRLVAPEEARYERGGLSAVVTRDGKSYAVTLRPDGEGGTVREAPAGGRVGSPALARTGREVGAAGGGGTEPKGEPRRAGRGGENRGGRGGESRGGREGGSASPFDVRGGLGLASSPLDRLEGGLPLVLAKIGLAGAKVVEVKAAPLSFQMEGGGSRWLVTYALQPGSVTGRPADPATTRELSTRRFLLSLHTTHGYPATFNARWIWAVLVDVMSLIMVFWGVSGLVMWWQIKKTRRIGTIMMALSIAAAAWVGVEMHGLLLAGGR